MKKYAVTDIVAERRSEARKQVDQYYNVEFLSDGIGGTHRLKILDKSPKSMCLLVKENSDIVPRLRVGDTLKMIYYSTHSLYPCVCLGAAVRRITKTDQGRFKGDYLVGLETLKSQD